MRTTFSHFLAALLGTTALAAGTPAATLHPLAATPLPGALTEVSGLAPASATSVYAQNDEQATVHEIDLASGKTLRSMSFGRPPLTGDFEAIIAADGRLALITSGGEAVMADIRERRGRLPFQVVDFGIDKECEVEGLARSENRYFLICKKAKRGLLVYEWSQGEGARKKIDLKLGDLVPNPVDFRATELVHDPETDSLLVLDSAAGAILEVSLHGKPLAYWRLGGDHPQAEGLALLADGRLVIADEGKMGGGSIGAGVLTIYPPRR